MMPQYEDWIKLNVQGDGYGMCEVYTEEMQKVFPELKRCRGMYYCPLWGQRTHWWMFDPINREIIDPTGNQFPSKGVGEYEELTDEYIEENMPIGVCANCGDSIYKSSECTNTVCSEKCGKEYVAYCMNPY